MAFDCAFSPSFLSRSRARNKSDRELSYEETFRAFKNFTSTEKNVPSRATSSRIEERENVTSNCVLDSQIQFAIPTVIAISLRSFCIEFTPVYDRPNQRGARACYALFREQTAKMRWPTDGRLRPEGQVMSINRVEPKQKNEEKILPAGPVPRTEDTAQNLWREISCGRNKTPGRGWCGVCASEKMKEKRKSCVAGKGSFSGPASRKRG